VAAVTLSPYCVRSTPRRHCHAARGSTASFSAHSLTLGRLSERQVSPGSLVLRLSAWRSVALLLTGEGRSVPRYPRIRHRYRCRAGPEGLSRSLRSIAFIKPGWRSPAVLLPDADSRIPADRHRPAVQSPDDALRGLRSIAAEYLPTRRRPAVQSPDDALGGLRSIAAGYLPTRCRPAV
jgi:hypothetical protein